MPAIIGQIRDKLKENDDDLKELGPAMPVEQADKMQLIWTMILEFLKTFEN